MTEPTAARSSAPLALDIRDLGLHFGALRAIDSVSLAVQVGERHVLLGTNGAGKTSLFNTISGDLRPSVGSIGLFGEDVTRIPSWRRARLGVARTYQSSLLFSALSVADNLYVAVRGARAGRFSLRREPASAAARREAQALAAQVGLAEHCDREVALLSHGQQRQLEIGMALASRPRLLLLDEPAAGLSPAERQMLIGLIAALPPALTIVLIEHDMDVALALADRVTVMKDGRVVLQGSPDEVRASPQVQLIYFGESLETAA